MMDRSMRGLYPYWARVVSGSVDHPPRQCVALSEVRCTFLPTPESATHSGKWDALLNCDNRRFVLDLASQGGVGWPPVGS